MHHHHKKVIESFEYKIIQETIQEMLSMGLVNRGSGHCFSMSDMIQKLLYKKGIKSELIECSVIVTFKNPPGMHFIGYHGLTQLDDPVNQMENHIVCVTKTETPYLIDLSIAHIDSYVPYVCVPIEKQFENTNLVEHDFGTSVWTYQQKLDSELPELHQRSILERINTDKKVEQNIQLLKKFVIGISILTTLNFVRGYYDFYQKYVVKDNGYGPNKVMVDSNHSNK